MVLPLGLNAMQSTGAVWPSRVESNSPVFVSQILMAPSALAVASWTPSRLKASAWTDCRCAVHSRGGASGSTVQSFTAPFGRAAASSLPSSEVAATQGPDNAKVWRVSPEAASNRLSFCPVQRACVRGFVGGVRVESPVFRSTALPAAVIVNVLPSALYDSAEIGA